MVIGGRVLPKSTGRLAIGTDIRGDPGGLLNVPCTDDMLIIMLCGLMLRVDSGCFAVVDSGTDKLLAPLMADKLPMELLPGLAGGTWGGGCFCCS